MPSVTLDATVVKNAVCTADKKRIDLYDTVIPGFIVEVRPSGSKTYYLRYRDVHNKQRQYKIGDAKSLTFDQAKSAAQTVRAKVVLGDDPSTIRTTQRKTLTLEEFVDTHYLPYIKKCKRGWKINLSTLKNHILPALKDQYLDTLTQQSIQRLLFKMKDDGYAAATINRVLTMLRYMYNLGKRWEIPGTDKNPTAGIPRFEENNNCERYLSSEEVDALLKATAENSNPQLKYIVMLLLLTGCRKRELLDAKWEHFDIPNRRWRIPMSKNGKPRFVPLSDDVITVLSQLPRFEGCPFIVPNPTTLQPFNCINHSWQTARKKAGLPDVRMHDLRHSFASFLINAGRSLYEVQKILGHTQITMTQRYAHLTHDTLLDATNAVSGVFNVKVNPSELSVGQWVGSKTL